MKKRIVIGDAIGILLLFIEILAINHFMAQLGATFYILLDLLLPALILFFINFGVNRKIKSKFVLINAILLTTLYITVSFVNGKTERGRAAQRKLDDLTVMEEESYQIDENIDIQITYSDGDGNGLIFGYTFYFVIALLGGKIGGNTVRS